MKIVVYYYLYREVQSLYKHQGTSSHHLFAERPTSKQRQMKINERGSRSTRSPISFTRSYRFQGVDGTPVRFDFHNVR